MHRATRALIYLIPSVANLWRDSQFLMCWDMAEALVAGGHHVYFALPARFRKRFESHFEGQGIPAPYGPPPGITMVWDDEMRRYSFPDQMRLVSLRYVTDYFSRRYGQYPIDWVYCIEPDAAAPLRTLISDVSKNFIMPVPVLVQEIMVTPRVDFDTSVRHLIDEPRNYYRVLGFMAGFPVFFSVLERERGGAEFERWLSPWAIREMQNRTLIRPIMLPQAKLDQVRAEVQKAERFTMFYGGRIGLNKNPGELLEILRAAHATAGDADVLISTPSKNITTAPGRAIQAAFASGMHLGVERDEFWRLAATAHVGLCASNYEGFGMAYLEQLYLGVPVVFRRAAWVKDMYPEWYPWTYKTPEEAVWQILDIKAHPDLTRDWMAKVQEWLVATFGVVPLMQWLHDFVQSKVFEPQESPNDTGLLQYCRLSPGQYTLLARATEYCRGKRITLHGLIRVMAKLGESYSSSRLLRGANAHLNGDYDLYRTLRDEWGLADDMLASTATFTIPADFTAPVYKE